jgi:hypothetical protein
MACLYFFGLAISVCRYDYGNSERVSATEAPRKPGALPNCNRPELQAATLAGLTCRTLPELAIGIARGLAKMVYKAWSPPDEGNLVFITVDGPWDLNLVDGPTAKMPPK